MAPIRKKVCRDLANLRPNLTSVKTASSLLKVRVLQNPTTLRNWLRSLLHHFESGAKVVINEDISIENRVQLNSQIKYVSILDEKCFAHGCQDFLGVEGREA